MSKTLAVITELSVYHQRIICQNHKSAVILLTTVCRKLGCDSV